MSDGAGQGSFRRRFAALFAAGFLGVLALAPTLPETLRALPLHPEAKAALPPMPVLVALSLIQPTLLMAGGVALGLALAPRLGLRSHLAESAAGEAPGLRAVARQAPLAVALSIPVDLLVLGLDVWVFRPWIGDAGAALYQEGERTLAVTLAGMLYGGITEELMVRWGLMSLLAWAGWKLFRRARGAGAGGDVGGGRRRGAALRGGAPGRRFGGRATHGCGGDPHGGPERAGRRRVRVAVLAAQPGGGHARAHGRARGTHPRLSGPGVARAAVHLLLDIGTRSG